MGEASIWSEKLANDLSQSANRLLRCSGGHSETSVRRFCRPLYAPRCCFGAFLLFIHESKFSKARKGRRLFFILTSRISSAHLIET